MAYDERLADRVRDLLAGEPALSERKMFGGLAFMLAGNMCCGIVGDRLRPCTIAAAQASPDQASQELTWLGRPRQPHDRRPY